MATPLDVAFADLDATEHGFVLGQLLAGDSHDGADRGAPLPSLSRARCARALGALAALPRADRVHVTATLAREALAPFPAGFDDVHGDHLRLAIGGESSATIRLVAWNGPPALRAVADALLAERGKADSTAAADASSANAGADAGAATEVIADLRRAVFASIVAVPPVAAGVVPQRWARQLAALAPAALLTAAAVTGADTLGLSLRGADDAIVRRAAGLLGAELAERTIAAARARDAAGPTVDTLARDRARALVTATRPASDPREAVARIGVRVLGDRLAREEGPRGPADRDLVLAVAQRLPLALAEDLLRGAMAPIDAAPA